jgi:DNA-binding transcriptional regulator YhcF (GntR family)
LTSQARRRPIGIADGLRALLVHGAFKTGDRLPTVRQLAIDLTVHHNTVAQAYRLLADEGWLDLRRHRGATWLVFGGSMLFVLASLGISLLAIS